MNNFYDQLHAVLTDSPSNRSVTENGAVGYKTTGKELLDLNFAVSSLRNASDGEISLRFAKACADDLKTAIVWLFFARDARGGGLGERRLFRVCMQYLAREYPDKVKRLIPLVAEYGRWDDLWCLLDTSVGVTVAELVKNQLANDIAAMRNGKSVSLLAKWMPSENTSSKETRKIAESLRVRMHISPRLYRKILSSLRKHIDVTERKMSANQWENIKYEAVPSRANIVYNSAFLKHDEERRREYLGKVENGEAKINASVLFPHDIVHRYCDQGAWCMSLKPYDSALESMWKALPNTVKDGEGTIVVADGSGSMVSNKIGKTKLDCWEVAHALAIYFAERLPEPFKNTYITFSYRPQLVKFGEGASLLTKLRIAYSQSEVANTNIEAVFDLILNTAINNHLKQSELPKNILIISDMEFDGATCERGGISRTLFGNIEESFRRAGYMMPRLVFWNVNSRTGTIPVKENPLGVALVSGFSPNVAKMVMSGKLDPYECLVATLNASRYDAVRACL